MAKLNPRQESFITTLRDLGGTATLDEIAKKSNTTPGRLNQCTRRLYRFITCIASIGEDMKNDIYTLTEKGRELASTL